MLSVVGFGTVTSCLLAHACSRMLEVKLGRCLPFCELLVVERRPRHVGRWRNTTVA